MAEQEKTPEQKLLEELKGKEATPLEFKIEETGEVVKGKDANELLENLKNMHVNTRKALMDARAERDALASAVAKLPAEPAEKSSDFSNEKYWAMVNAGDIVGAQNYVDSIRFGIPPEEVVETIATTVNDAKYARDKIVSAEFKMANPDYPATQEAADAVANEVKRMQNEAQQEGEPIPRWSVRTLNAAWDSVKRSGKVQPLDTSKNKEEEPQGAPPTLRGGTGGGRTVDETLAEMIATQPLEKVEEALRKAGRLQ